MHNGCRWDAPPISATIYCGRDFMCVPEYGSSLCSGTKPGLRPVSPERGRKTRLLHSIHLLEVAPLSGTVGMEQQSAPVTYSKSCAIASLTPCHSCAFAALPAGGRWQDRETYRGISDA